MEEHAQNAGYELSAQQFERFQQLVRAHSGIALRPEKHQLVCSRLARRLRALALSSFDEYLALLARQGPDGEELEQLLNAITTNKTSFFREAHHFSELCEHVLKPKLQRAGAPRLRVWSAGCSTGEEPYSVVATLLQATPRWEQADIAVLASDLDTNVLAVGERGVYPAEKLDELPTAIAKRWFVHGTGDKASLIRVRKELRQRVGFRRINFIEPDWPVRTRFDAIFCRNALIYFEPPMQREIAARLLAHLEPGGLLFLGHAESMAGARPDLRSLGRTSYVYLGGGS